MSPDPEQKPTPTLEERLTDAVFKLIVACSGGYALYNLYLEDIPKAAIAGLIAFGSGLVTSFGQGLMTQLSDRMKQRGDSVGKFANQSLDSTVEKTLTRLTGFHAQYLEALKTHCYNLNVEGYKGRLPRLVLENVYVPLRVNLEAQQNTLQLGGSQTIWNLLPKQQDSKQTFPHRLMAIIADPGYGKTTLMRFLTLSFANENYKDYQAKELIPVLLLFREIYPQIQSQHQPPLPQLIVEQVQKLPRCSELQTSRSWFDEQLMQGKCLIMLDGLDEVPEAQRERVSQWANWQMQNYPTQFILTSRPHGFDRDLFVGVQPIDVLDFNNDQKRRFIEQWYRFITWELTWKSHWQESQYDPNPQNRLTREQAEAESHAQAQRAADDLSRQLFADPNLTDLAKNPLLITIIAATHEGSENLPSQRIPLYREIFKLLLEYRPNRRDTRLTIDNAEDNQRILQKLALALTGAGKTQFSPQQGVEWIKDRFTEVYKGNTLTPKAFFQEIQQVSGLLAGGEGELYEFTHKTFQEYLAAQELRASEGGANKIREKFTDPNWEEVVYFFAVADPTPLIKAALEDPTNLYTLQLARRLANDNSQVDETLRQALLDRLQQQEPASAKVRLEQRFRHLTALSDTTALSDPITWGEYQLFLRDQKDQQFHSWAEDRLITPEQSDHLVTDIHWEDARWFCAWLSTQSHLAPGDDVYDYRLPTLEEYEATPRNTAPLQPWTTDPSQPGNALWVVQQRIPDRYANLVNYLATAQWKDADRETDKMMLEAVGQAAVERGYLKLEEIRNFPCEDLRLIDQLWVKFSGGKFGFSIQKQIYVECGGKLDGKYPGEEIWERFGDRVGWRKDGNWLSYSHMDPSPLSSPRGIFPRGLCGMLGGGWWLGVRDGYCNLFSRTKTCRL
ncbi:MAG: GUN4 domain-containing protein [Leptolyngbyaceae cyanobacterium bins.59]|nr:GUN4 domain-containing protein [Leptolyngbyaceae cyanobacterium bins.59]